MTSPAFFRTKESLRVLQRAAKCTATPLSLHYVDNGNEGPKILGIGQCSACAYIAELAEGKAACRDCRVEAAEKALRRQRPTPFICHMGFPCVACPAVNDRGAGFALTFGPYCPLEAPESLLLDAISGLEKLGEDFAETLPFSLEDIPLAHSDAIPEIAQWTADSLTALMAHESGETEDDAQDAAVEQVTVKKGRKRANKTLPSDPYHSASMAASLAAGDQPQARALFRAMLAEGISPASANAIRVMRARTIACVSAVLEAAERADLPTGKAEALFHDLIETSREAHDEKALTNCAMRVLSKLLQKKTGIDEDPKLRELNKMLSANLRDGITLNEIARRLGEQPSTITHRLQRKFGMSFSQYLGRLRVDKAKELLRRTKLGMIEVAARVGISDTSNFSSLFRKLEHISPTEYRKKFRKKP